MRIPVLGRAAPPCAACLLAAVLGLSIEARAFTHPCIPTALQELDPIKANFDKAPWKSGFASLASASTSQLTWPMGQNTVMTLKPSSLGGMTLHRIGRAQYNDPYRMGRIDEFRIYGRALFAPEVVSLMNTSPAGFVPAPASLTTTPGSGQVSLGWSPVPGATSYGVLGATTSGGPFLDVATGLTTTTYTNTGLTTGTTYSYVIVAHTATSESPDSPIVSAAAQ